MLTGQEFEQAPGWRFCSCLISPISFVRVWLCCTINRPPENCSFYLCAWGNDAVSEEYPRRVNCWLKTIFPTPLWYSQERLRISVRFAIGSDLIIKTNLEHGAFILGVGASNFPQYVAPDIKFCCENVKTCRFSSGNWFSGIKFMQLAMAGKRRDTVVHLSKRV